MYPAETDVITPTVALFVTDADKLTDPTGEFTCRLSVTVPPPVTMFDVLTVTGCGGGGVGGLANALPQSNALPARARSN